MADDLNVTPGAGTTVRARDPGDGKLRQVIASGAIDTDGATQYSAILAAAANQDSTVVKASAGNVYSITVHNENAAVRYLKLYDKATGPTSADTPIRRIPLRPDTLYHFTFDTPIKFTAGISFRVTTGLADSDTGAATTQETVVNIDYA